MINKKLFENVYNECIKIIKNSDNTNILKKKDRLEEAYLGLIENNDFEHEPFYSIVHELRTYDFLSKKGYIMLPSDDNKGGPDFYNDKLGYVECVSVTKGDEWNKKYVDEVLARNTNRYESALSRITSQIKDKTDKYASYLNKKIIEDNKPRIIAINTSIFSNEFHHNLISVLMIKILYGNIIKFDNDTSNIFKIHFYDDDKEKMLEKTLELDYFLNEYFSNISGIILINNFIGEEITDDLFTLFLNPIAKVKLNKDYIKQIRIFDNNGNNKC